MNIKFVTKDLMDASKAIKNIFAKGPVADKDNNQGCLVASKDDGSVSLESANQGLYATVRLEAEVEDAGRVVVDRDYLSGLRLRADSTVFKHKESANRMGFKSGNLKGDFSVSQEFDEIDAQRPTNIPDFSIEIEGSILRNAIKRVMFTSNDEEDPLLKLQLAFKKSRLLVTANDHYRATLFATKLDDEIEAPAIIIPAAFFASVIGSMPADEPIKIGIGKSLIRIAGGGIDVCHPVLQDVSPVDVENTVKSISSEDANIEFMLDVPTAKDAIASVASIVPASQGANIRMELAVTEKGVATVKVESAVGNADCKFKVTNVTIRKEGSVKVSSRYLLEFLSLFSDGEAQVRIWDKPIILKSEQYGTTLVMPQLS